MITNYSENDSIIVMVNYLMGHNCVIWRFLFCSVVLRIIYSWQSYYVLARKFKLSVLRKYIYSFVGEVVRKGKIVVSRYLELVTLRNLAQIRVGDSSKCFCLILP